MRQFSIAKQNRPTRSSTTHWDKGNVGNEFGRGRTSEENGRLVLGGIDWASHVGVGLLEVFVESVLKYETNRIQHCDCSERAVILYFPYLGGTLHGVTEECWRPASATKKGISNIKHSPTKYLLKDATHYKPRIPSAAAIFLQPSMLPL